MQGLDEGTVTQITAVPVTESMVRGEIDALVTTAKRYPRDIATFRGRCTALSCLDEDTAASCMYALPRGGKTIEGPSIRFAEILAATWGNLRVATRLINEGAKSVTMQGVCHDLENNTAISIEVQRRITDRYGKRYNDDMVGVTENAAASVALRNAILKVVPQAIWKEAFEETRRMAIGDASTLSSKCSEMMIYFQKMGVMPDAILRSVGKESTDEITLDNLGTLKGVATAIKDGDTTVDQAFPPAPKTTDAKPGESQADALARAVSKAAEPEKAETPKGEPKGKKKNERDTLLSAIDLYAKARPDAFGVALTEVGLDEGELKVCGVTKLRALLQALEDEAIQAVNDPMEGAAPST